MLLLLSVFSAAHNSHSAQSLRIRITQHSCWCKLSLANWSFQQDGAMSWLHRPMLAASSRIERFSDADCLLRMKRLKQSIQACRSVSTCVREAASLILLFVQWSKCERLWYQSVSFCYIILQKLRVRLAAVWRLLVPRSLIDVVGLSTCVLADHHYFASLIHTFSGMNLGRRSAWKISRM